MMHMEHRQVQTQRQQLMLSQRMQQALHILQLHRGELEQFVQEQLETNPFLEQAPPREAPELPAEPPKSDPDGANGFDENFDLDAFRDSLTRKHRERRDLSVNRDLDARRQYFQDSITQEESLRAHLLQQLRMSAADPVDHAIGERIIIGDINDRGYFTGDAAAIAEELEVAPERVEGMLRHIQGFEPTGVGARDIVECLLLQIAVEFPGDKELETLVRDHFEALKNRRIPEIAKAMKTTPERIEEIRARLARLNPWPGHEYASAPTQYVAPEVVVELQDDEYVVRLASDRYPELRINDKFYDQIAKSARNKDEKSFIRKNIDAARWLERNIAERDRTILRVAQAIVDVQRDFIEKGVEHIKPLTLQDIADRVGVHESTVARTTRGKYIQTPQGVFELKYFFSTGLKTESGEDQSAKSVQAAVRKIIEEEDKRKPLSDQKIADMLNKEGLNIARRTVTKYRKAMNIPSTTRRRQYTKAAS